MEVLSTYKHNLKRLAVAEYKLPTLEAKVLELSDKLRDLTQQEEDGLAFNEQYKNDLLKEYYTAQEELREVIKDITASEEMIELCEEYLEELPFEYPED